MLRRIATAVRAHLVDDRGRLRLHKTPHKFKILHLLATGRAVSAGRVPMAPTSVTFQVLEPRATPGDYGSREDPSVYVSLEDPASDIANMLDKDAVVIPKDTINVRVDYPLDGEFTFELRSDAPEGFKRGELAQKIADLYHHIYKVESETAPDPGRAAPNLLNRGRSHGEYGIWGHDLGDLVLHTVEYNEKDGVWELGIDS